MSPPTPIPQVAVYDGSDNLVMRFQYADARMPYAMTKSGTTYYLTYDSVGTLLVVADPSGNVVKRIEYDSFGNVIADTDPSFEVPFGFAGGLHDRDTGLVRFGYRDYDPDIGRWTAKDPIFFAGGDTDLYGYCLNDPVNVDPGGLQGYWWHPGRSFSPTGPIPINPCEEVRERYRRRAQYHKDRAKTWEHMREIIKSIPPGETPGYLSIPLSAADEILRFERNRDQKKAEEYKKKIKELPCE
ncbi:MAG: RHS repeat-associated core domain-containing protein [Deltaproteobacteria bacterium]|nr:RHS repeat-associated core domain-containing protein [Deltaproteobacteria bacterium]